MEIWNLNQFGTAAAVIDEYGTSVSYQALHDFGLQLAEAVGGRCLVFGLCENSIGSILGYTAFLNHGIVPLLLNCHLERSLLRNLMDTYAPSFLWLPDRMVCEFSALTPVCSAYGYSLLKCRFEHAYSLHPDLALLLTTSGSTGSPKLVRQSYTNVRVNAESIADYLHLDATERPITTLPMNYTYGLSILNSHLMVGATILATEKSLMQKEFWAFFRSACPTSFGGVPYTYEMLYRMRFMQMDLPSLRTMTQAGGKLTCELHRKFAEYAQATGRNFVVMYGQCEATARMGYLPPEQALNKCGSMGIAIPGGSFRLLGSDSQPITAPHTTGELVYEGPNVTMGYAEQGSDLALGDVRRGVLHTGDMAQFDEDGCYYIVGRKKRFLKIFGNRVNLDEVERLIKGSFDGIDCASAGVDDHMYLFVTDEALAAPVRDFTARKTGLNRSAFHTVVLDRIPKNDAGKILYKDLAQYYE